MNKQNTSSSRLKAIPKSVWVLGFVSLFMDVSSEMIHSLLPVFLVTGLGASVTMVGLIEGVGEATAAFTKLGSGWLSDRLGKRKSLAVIGYSLSSIAKPLFAIALSPLWVMFARLTDRVGKGVRDAPRDALITDLTPKRVRGAAFGLRQSLDTVGAFAGPLLAILLMSLFAGDFRRVFWIAAIPAFLAVALLVVGVKKSPHEKSSPPFYGKDKPRLSLKDIMSFTRIFWIVVVIASFMTLARFSEAFLILSASEKGLPANLSPLVLVGMNVVYAFASFPAGFLSDLVDRRYILAMGMVVLILSDVVLAVAPTLWISAIGIGLWGLHMGLTQGLLSALISDAAPKRLRATAFGIFHLASGVMFLLANLIAGILWDQAGSSATFLASAIFTCIALTGLVAFIHFNADKVGSVQ